LKNGDLPLEGLHFAVLLERGTNPTEFHYSRLRLQEAGAKVTVIGGNRLEYELEDHSTGYADTIVDQVKEEDFDGVIIPGGLGPEKLRLNTQIVDFVKGCYERGKLCAAICHGQQVLISAGLLRGVKATAAWSMKDDLRAVGAIVPEGVRAVRDGQIVTAMFPQDLPEFFHLIFQTLADLNASNPADGCPKGLSGQTWGIVVDNASNDVQVRYLRLRILEEGGTAVLLGRRAGENVKLSSPQWEWGEMGWGTVVERALPDPGLIESSDTEAEQNGRAVRAAQLDGLLLPGGLGTWMIRAHPGLRQLILEMNASRKPIGAVERGAKLLLMTGILDGRSITCAPEMRDDVLQAIEAVRYQDKPVVRDGNLVTAQGTDDLPRFMQALIRAYGNR
jgi:protease I